MASSRSSRSSKSSRFGDSSKSSKSSLSSIDCNYIYELCSDESSSSLSISSISSSISSISSASSSSISSSSTSSISSSSSSSDSSVSSSGSSVSSLSSNSSNSSQSSSSSSSSFSFKYCSSSSSSDSSDSSDSSNSSSFSSESSDSSDSSESSSSQSSFECFNGVRKIRSDWPVTEKLKDWTRNPLWQKGFKEVNEGTFDILQPIGFSTMWAFLSAAQDGPLSGELDIGVGQIIYEKIANIVQNIRDIDTSTMVALKSMANEMDVQGIQFYDIDYPLELREMMDILSVKETLLLTSGQMITDIDLDNIRQTLQTGHISGKLSGYDPLDPIWSDAQSQSISALQNVSGYTVIPDDDYLIFAERELSCIIVRNILIDDGVILQTLNTTDIPPDTEDIEDLKDLLSVPERFSAYENANLVLAGVNLLESYTDTEQAIIQAELDRRSEQTFQFGTQATRFLVDRTNIVRNYIQFVEDVNLYTSSIKEDECGFVVDGQVSSFFARDEYGEPISGQMITNTVHMLRNIIVETSYQRDYLKQIAQKTAIIGASQIVTSLLNEYITRNYRSPEFWRLFRFEGTENALLSSIMDSAVSGVQGQIEVVEYFDATEYMNLSTPIDFRDNVNNRFWEGFENERNVINSDITSACVSSFYNDIGITSGLSETSGILKFLYDVYDMGAMSATTDEFATFFTLPVDVAVTGEFGEFGGWEYVSTDSPTTSTYSITSNVEPIYGYEINSNTSAWQSSEALASVPVSDFAAAWAQVPVVSSWQTDFYLSGGDVSGWGANPNIQAWIDDTFGVSSWLNNIHTNIWKTSVLVNSWIAEDFRDLWELSVNANSGSTDLAIDNVWRNVDTLINDTYGWQAIPEVSSFLNSNPSPTQTQWNFAGEDFIQTWVNAPFTSAITSNTFKPDDHWKISPFVTTWTDDPFDLVLVNSGIIQVVSGDLETINTALCSVSAIDGPDGGIYRLSSITSGSLSGMHLKYLGSPSGDFPPANIKNVVHPTVAITPYIWNLKEQLRADETCTEQIFLGRFPDRDTATSLLSSRINEYGSTVSSWIDDVNEYTGYKTYFEDSRNLDFRESLNKYIDRDGPWHPNALSAYLNDPVTVAQELTGGTSPYFSQIILHPADVTKIANQLIHYQDDIRALSAQTIYQHSIDKFGNHYTLFKSEDEHDTQGRIWMRFLNHPFSFPLVDPNGDFELSQMDTDINNVTFLRSTTNYCNDFNFLNDNFLMVLGANPNVITPATDQQSGISGFVSLASVGFESFFEEDNRTKLLAFKDENLVFEGWNLTENQKFVGWYGAGADQVILTYINNNQKIGFDDYTVSGPNGFGVQVRFNVYDPNRSLVETRIDNFITPYDEYRLPLTGGFHNQWRLAKNNTILTLAFESECPDYWITENFDITGGMISGEYLSGTNEDCSLYDNGVTTIDFTVTNATVYGHNPMIPEHFCKYSELTYIGANAGDDKFYLDNGVGLQFFGNAGTSATFCSGKFGPFSLTKEFDNSLVVCLSSETNPFTWEALPQPWGLTDIPWSSSTSGYFQCNDFDMDGERYTYAQNFSGDVDFLELAYSTDGCTQLISTPESSSSSMTDVFSNGCMLAPEEDINCNLLTEDGCRLHAEDCGGSGFSSCSSSRSSSSSSLSSSSSISSISSSSSSSISSSSSSSSISSISSISSSSL